MSLYHAPMSLNITMMVAFSVLHQLLLAQNWHILMKCQIVAHTPRVYWVVCQEVCCNGNNILKSSEFSGITEMLQGIIRQCLCR